MKKTLLLPVLFLSFYVSKSQTCNPQGDEVTYGTNNIWIGYVYDNIDLTSYKGSVTEGATSNPDFDESFGGSNTTYNTNGCSVQTTTFSVRYKLTKTFTNGNYDITVGGDDGYRLSLDGGATWVINKWVDQSYASTTYTVALNGTYNMVLEYYENGGDNRISISIGTSCTGTENTATYGTGNIWNAYVYDGTNFNIYKGMTHEGSATDPSFDESFGGSNVYYSTSGCSVQTETFSVRYRLTTTFAGLTTFFVGGDDGYRLSLDGGTTWVINKWNDQSYTVNSYTANLNGSYNLVLEYYENGGDNRISFNTQSQIPLPIKLLDFAGAEKNGKASLTWDITSDSNPDHFDIERSTDGISFSKIGTVNANNNPSVTNYNYSDALSVNGKSFYRLKMIDQTGVITYSSTIALNINSGSNKAISIFPTIVTNNSINMQAGVTMNNTSVIIADMQGRTIATKELGKMDRGQIINLNTGNLVSVKGVYFIQVFDGTNRIDVKRFIVQ